jgi:hypothetical protein
MSTYYEAPHFATSPFSFYFIPLRSKYSPSNPALTPPVYALSLVGETKFNTHTKLAELMVLYNLTFTFLDSRREDKRV